ncbi:Alpha/Beta hydrolase protein [Xylariaceae sp. FL1272]|nr:Alpha/Beta hydrolase protein [Xylariaceae sp. FL1272]
MCFDPLSPSKHYLMACLISTFIDIEAQLVKMFKILSFIFIATLVRGTVLVPELTGPHSVGTTVLELKDHSRQDPFAPSPSTRDLVVSLFYPTSSRCGRNSCTLAAQFPPITAQAIVSTYNITSDVAGIITRSCLDSVLTKPHLPWLLFSPGLGDFRLYYSDLAEDLASYGWNVVTIDHPYDSPIVEYPDGHIVLASQSPNVDNATYNQLLDVRVADLIFVLDSLANSTIVSQIPGLNTTKSPREIEMSKYSTTKLPTHSVGVFGHSFGGAASLQVMASDKRFKVGANMDGSVFGDVVSSGTDKPFMFISRPDHNQTTDDTWREVWKNLRGFKREYSVEGALHGDFTDLPVLRDLFGGLPGPLGDQLGTIKGTKVEHIKTTFLGALFDRFLKGKKAALLDETEFPHWPEVSLVDSS